MPLVLNSSSISGLSPVDGLSSPQTGSVLQVVNAGNTSATNVNGTNITVQTASITPKFSTSKILVIFSCGSADNASNGGEIAFYLKRGGSTGTILPLQNASQTGYLFNTNRLYQAGVTFTYLDSPATTSATTYGMYCTTASSPSPQVNGAQITLMEIAA